MLRLAERMRIELRRFVADAAGGTWQRALFRVMVIALVLTVGAVGYAWTGLAFVSASSGHSQATYWFLDFAKRKAVRTQSAGIEIPPLEDAAQVLKGAGHYATGCAPCHGAPGKRPAVVAKRMTPEPPYLPAKLDRWETEELFWIVKHGIKFTGMPAWPALERDDEVWAMVSFLRALPEMDAAQYERLAYGERSEVAVASGVADASPNDLHAMTDAFGSVLDNCVRCHGVDGAGRADAFPRLAGQRETYLFESLRAFADGTRHSGIMQPVASDLEEDAMRALAGHYARQRAATTNRQVRGNIERGREIAERGLPARGIPACRQCHGPDVGARNPVYPELAGQYADYLLLQLELFKANKRGGTPYAHIMETVTRGMTHEDMQAAALYYASLPAEREGR